MLTKYLLLLATIGLASAQNDHKYLAPVAGNIIEGSYQIAFNTLRNFTSTLETCAVTTYVVVDLAAYTALCLGVPFTNVTRDARQFLRQLRDELSPAVRRGFYATAVAFDDRARRFLWEESRRLGLALGK